MDALSGVIGGAQQGASASGGNPWATAGGAVLGGVMSAIGGNAAKSAQKKYEAYMNNYIQQLKAVDLPKYEELMLALERYEKGEDLTPVQMTILQETQNNVSKIADDSVNKETQLEAIAALKARAQGGLTLQDKADLLEAQQQIDRQSQGAQKAIMQNMAARGMAGSGQELAARLMGSQQGAQLAAQTGLNVAAQSRAEALNALKDASRLSESNAKNQFNRDQVRAQSQDDMLRRNLDRQQQSMLYNVGAQNEARLQNLKRAQQVADSNVDISNVEQKYNKELKMDDYNNQIKRLQDIHAIQGPMEAAKAQAGKDKQAGISSFMNEAGGAFSSLKNAFKTPGVSPNSTQSGSTQSSFGNDYSLNMPKLTG